MNKELVTMEYPSWLQEKDMSSKKYEADIVHEDEGFLTLSLTVKTPKGEERYRYEIEKDTGNMWMHGEHANIMMIPFHQTEYMKLLPMLGNEAICKHLMRNAWGNIWDFDYDKAQEDLQAERDEAIAYYGEDEESVKEVLDDFDQMTDILSEMGSNVVYHGGFLTLWGKYHGTCEGVEWLGKQYSPEFYSLLIGLLEACEKVGLIRFE